MAVVFKRCSSCGGPISNSVPPFVNGELARRVSCKWLSLSALGTHNETRRFFNDSISLLSNEKFLENESPLFTSLGFESLATLLEDESSAVADFGREYDIEPLLVSPNFRGTD